MSCKEFLINKLRNFLQGVRRELIRLIISESNVLVFKRIYLFSLFIFFISFFLFCYSDAFHYKIIFANIALLSVTKFISVSLLLVLSHLSGGNIFIKPPRRGFSFVRLKFYFWLFFIWMLIVILLSWKDILALVS